MTHHRDRVTPGDRPKLDRDLPIGEPEPSPRPLERLDGLLDKLDRTLEVLAHVTEPVTLRRGIVVEAETTAKLPEPPSHLHGQIDRLAALVDRLETTTGRIDL